jgi:hypothetical protein
MPLTKEEPEAEEAPQMFAATAVQRALYIEDMVRELERLAKGADLERLRDLLRLAREEARRKAFG